MLSVDSEEVPASQHPGAPKIGRNKALEKQTFPRIPQPKTRRSTLGHGDIPISTDAVEKKRSPVKAPDRRALHSAQKLDMISVRGQ